MALGKYRLFDYRTDLYLPFVRLALQQLRGLVLSDMSFPIPGLVSRLALMGY